MKAYLWIDEARDGYENMAIDEALAYFAIHENALVLRFYRWSRPFLTLGYFQRAEDRLIDDLLARLPYTRRLSGGGAIVHDRELTYSLVMPDSKEKKSAASDIYCTVHTGMRTGLSKFGWDVESAGCSLQGQVSSRDHTPEEPFLCFHRRTSADLVIAAHKVVGSAQRRVGAALMQHGSLLLQRSEFAPELLGLNDLPASRERPAMHEVTLALAGEIQLQLSSILPQLSWSPLNLLGVSEGNIASYLKQARIRFQSSEWIQKC